MLGWVVRWSLDRPRLIAWACLWFTLLGLLYVHDMKVELMPAIDPVQATVDTEASGLVAGQVEATVTRPIEAALLGTPGVARVESRSVQGQSVITLHFAADADPVRVRQSVTENLGRVGPLPAGTSPPRLSPLIAPGGDVMKIGFVGAKSPIELHQIVQWLVRPRLLSAPGVARVAIYGGEIPRIEVRARPADLSDSDLGFLDVVNAVRRATSIAGAGFIDTPNQRVLIEPHGQAETLDEVRDGQIQTAGSDPVRIDDIADVSEEPAPSYGGALIGGQPAVVVAVNQTLGANTLDTTHAVEQALAVLRPLLAAQGVTIRTDLDRPASFVSGTAAHIAWSLGIGVILAGIALFIFMRDVRVVLVTLMSVPLTCLVTLMALKAFGFTLNVMTLGGLAVALGLIIDDAVIDVEGMLSDLPATRGDDALRQEAIVAASLEVRAPLFYATLALVAALVPLLFVSGPGGTLLAALALTIVIASLASLFVALTATPALALLLFHTIEPGRHIAALDRLKARHAAWLERIDARPGLFMAGTAAPIILALAALLLFRGELVPPIHDGHIVASTDAPASISPAANRATGHAMATDIAAISGVRTVSEEIGRDPTVDDAAGIEHRIVDVDLAPDLGDASQAEIADNVQRILARYDGGMPVTSSRFDAAEPTGGTPALKVGVLGQDLDMVDRTARDVARTLGAMPGGAMVETPSTERAPTVRIDLNFAKLALFGLSASDVLETVQAAFAGEAVAHIYQGTRVEDLVIIGPDSLRQDPEGVGNLLLRSTSGFAVPLRSVANVYLTESRAVIEHDGGIPRQLVTAALRSGDIDRFARAARSAIDAQVKRPPGVFVTYELANSAARTRDHLALAYALGLFGVFAFLALAFDGLTAALILLSSGFSFVGGALAIALTGGVLSIGPLAGLAALLGLSTRSAILMISQAEDLVLERSAPWTLATVTQAASDRFAAILASAALIVLALTPLALRASAAGMEILGRMAIVIIAGVIVGAIGDLVVLPIMLWHAWEPRAGQLNRPDEFNRDPTQGR